MSRYEWKTEENIICSIGWDRPMRTFFAQIHDESIDDDDETDKCLLWLGSNFDEFTELQPMLERFGEDVPQEVLIHLEADKLGGDLRGVIHLPETVRKIC